MISFFKTVLRAATSFPIRIASVPVTLVEDALVLDSPLSKPLKKAADMVDEAIDKIGD